MGNFWKTNSSQRDEILAAYRAGEQIETIASRYGIHNSYICRLAQKQGLPMRGRGYVNLRGGRTLGREPI